MSQKFVKKAFDIEPDMNIPVKRDVRKSKRKDSQYID